MKKEPFPGKTCGDCIHNHIGILEKYCHRRDKKVEDKSPACESFNEITNITTTITSLPFMETKETTTVTKKTDATASTPVRLHNAARSLKTDMTTLRDVIDKTGVQYINIGEGRTRQKALTREDFAKIKETFRELRLPKVIVPRKKENPPKPVDLASVEDKALVEELRKRGFTVKCTKQIIIEL